MNNHSGGLRRAVRKAFRPGKAGQTGHSCALCGRDGEFLGGKCIPCAKVEWAAAKKAVAKPHHAA